jgi:hypothetical protein
MLRLTTAVLALAAGASGCTKPGSLSSNNQNGAKLVSVKMKMPTKIGDKDITGKMDGYSLSIKKTGGDCIFTDIARVEKVAADDVKIDASLRQGCDYSLLLSFGKVSADGKKIDQIFLTSDAHDKKAALPTAIKKEELQGKTAITVKACVSVTELGAKELGVSLAACPSVADDSTETVIDPVIAQPSLTFKLTRPATPTISGSNLLLSAGEITSISSAVKFCAIAAEVKFMGTAMKRAMLEDAVIEVKPGDKKNIDKTIDIKEITDAGPNNVSEVKIMESCLDIKPEASTTALSLIDKCTASGTCTVIRP